MNDNIEWDRLEYAVGLQSVVGVTMPILDTGTAVREHLVQSGWSEQAAETVATGWLQLMLTSLVTQTTNGPRP